MRGTYDWSTLDAAIATSAGKPITLHVLGGAYANSAPSWLEAAGVVFYSYSIAGLDRVVHVSIAVPIPEMTLVGCVNGMLGTTPYDRARYYGAWTRMVDLYALTFPDQTRLLSTPQNGICAADADFGFYSDLIAYAKTGANATRVLPFAADLSANGSTRAQPFANAAPFAFQPVAACSNDPNHWVLGALTQLYCAGLAQHGTYFEVYPEDLDNPDPTVLAGIAAIHDPTSCP